MSPAVIEAAGSGQFNQYQRLGGVNQQVNVAWLQAQSCQYAYMYEHQPAVRKVVDFIARNAAQMTPKLYERVSDTEREPASDHPAALTMAHPNELNPADQFVFNVFADYLIHDNAYVLKFRGVQTGPRVLIQVPAAAVAVNSNARYTIDSYRIYRSDGTYVDVDPADVIHWRGFNPSDPRIGFSRLETLRQLLAQANAADVAVTELYKSGLSKPGYLKRSLDAPELSAAGAERIVQKWANSVKASPRITPMLEEGMEFADFGVSPEDAQMLESRKFSSDEVAAAYGMEHCPPQDEDERQQFISDVLAPYTKQFACLLDFALLGVEYAETDYYFEFDLNEKLRGDPVARFQAITSATGAPWLLRNEARALENLPAVDGGDDLVVPLNVTEEGEQSPALPAPNVMPPQDPNKPPQDGSYRENPKALTNGHDKALAVSTQPRRLADMARQRRYIDEARALLDRYYARQRRVMKSKGQKAANSDKWDSELASDIEKLARGLVDREGGIYVARLGGHDFDMRQVDNYLQAMAEGTAEGLNRATQRDIVDMGADAAFDRAINERSPIAAASIGARTTYFARTEAAKQAPNSEHRMQTWIANTERHAELDGVSVPLGSDWGGISPGSEANCACSASIF